MPRRRAVVSSQASGCSGDAVGGPAAQGGLDGVLDEVLGGGEVAQHPHQARRQPARVLSDHAGQLGAHLVLRVCRVVRVRGVVRRWHPGQVIGRISTTGQPGHVRASAIASSRSATSISA